MTFSLRSPTRWAALSALMLLSGLGAGCRNVQFGSWSAREDVLLEDGICSVFEKGVLYSEFWHNAPRRQVHESMSATMRFADSGATVEVEVVESCPAPSLEIEYVPGPDQEVRVTGARGTWRIRESGSRSRPIFQVAAADGSIAEFPAGALIDSGTAIPAVAPADDIFYVVTDRVDSRTIGVGRLDSGSLSAVRIPHERLFALAIGERVIFSPTGNVPRP